MSTTLEQRVATALVADTTSANLAALIAETEAAITQADVTASAERTKALDPVLSPDAKAAREAMAAAEFDRDRLCTVLPRLQQRHQELEMAEHVAAWENDRDRVEVLRDAAAKNFAKYSELVAQIVDLLRDAEQVDKAVSCINGSAPPGPYRHLLGVECVARGLPAFSASEPQISKGVQLPDYEHSALMAWPVRCPPDLTVTPAMVAHPGADWASDQNQRAQAMRAENERRMKYYASMAQQREEREHAAPTS
jgi:hypothetical protein